MSDFSFKKTFINGIAFAVPVSIILYGFIRLVQVFEKLIGPVAKKMGIDRLFGEITLLVIAIFLILVLIFICGLLMQLSFISKFRLYLEGWILRLVPSLNYLKVIADEKLDAENASVQWKPVFIWRTDEEKYAPAYLIEETDKWITLVYTKFPTTEPGELLITKRSTINYKEITMKEMHQYNREFGKGYLSLVDNSL